MFYLEKNSNLISLLDNAWILEGEVTRESLLVFKGLTTLGAYSEAPS